PPGQGHQRKAGPGRPMSAPPEGRVEATSLNQVRHTWSPVPESNRRKGFCPDGFADRCLSHSANWTLEEHTRLWRERRIGGRGGIRTRGAPCGARLLSKQVP